MINVKKENSTSINIFGEVLKADKDGVIKCDPKFLDVLISHGFKIVEDKIELKKGK